MRNLIITLNIALFAAVVLLTTACAVAYSEVDRDINRHYQLGGKSGAASGAESGAESGGEDKCRND